MAPSHQQDPVSLAHDLNNLLMIVLNATELLPEPTGDDPAQNPAETIRTAAKKASELARAIMRHPASIAAADAGDSASGTAADLVPTSMQGHMAFLRPLLASATGQTADFAMDIEESLPPAAIDRDAFGRLLVNFVKNAVEAFPAGTHGHITLHARRAQPNGRPIGSLDADPEGLVRSPLPPDAGRAGLLFSVEDDGPGFPEALLPTLFKERKTTKATGTGIGTSEAPRLASLMGGCVTYRPASPHGAIFSVWLPECIQAPAPEPAATTTPKAGQPAATPQPFALKEKGAQILLLDDDPGILRATSILLRSLGVTPIGAGTMDEAAAAFNANLGTVRAAFLDANIGDQKTVPLLAAIKESAPNLPCVIVSGYSPEKTAEVFADTHYDAFLGKPFTRNELKNLLIRIGLAQ